MAYPSCQRDASGKFPCRSGRLILQTLPIDPLIGSIRTTLLNHNRLILQAPPGAGKTTAVPLAFLDAPWLENKKILMLEPRRIAARSAASRMAKILGEKVGMSVGYQIRSEKKISRDTKIVVITEGILTRMVQNDPFLEDVALVIFDEFHERHLHSDLSLAFVLQTQEILRDDLKILVMSATLDTRALENLLNHPPLLCSEGRTFAVETIYLNPNDSKIVPKNLVASLSSLLPDILNTTEGNILVFLPGSREIKALKRLLMPLEDSTQLEIFPLYGELSKEDQEKAINPSNKRKIVLATNIAETSLTIDGIRIVIDSGYEKVLTFDPRSGMERLITQRISRASADQRAGRAGRLMSGICFRLWSEHEHATLAPHKMPEICTCDLTTLALELAHWGESDLTWIDSPPSKALQHGIDLLRMLGAVDDASRISDHGKAMMNLGLHPRLAHMILKAQSLGYGAESILVSALLHEKDLFSTQNYRSTDLRERFDILKEMITGAPIASELLQNARVILQTVRDLSSRLAIPLHFAPNFSSELIALLLAFAYPDRIAKLRTPKGGKYLLSNSKEAILPQEDDLFGEEWLVIADNDGDKTVARIYRCAPLEITLVEKHLPELFRIEKSIGWNSEQKRVEARETRFLGSIPLESRPMSNPEVSQIHSALLEGIRLHGLSSLPWSDKALSLLYRLRTLQFHEPLQGLGDFQDETLLATLEHWLLPYLGTRRSIKECDSLDMESILASCLSWEQLQHLNLQFPASFFTPANTSVTLDYSDPEAVVMAVRIQEVFGLDSHPSIRNGQLALVVHLLSPARRPIQITKDLVGFWNTSYSEVKKELKGRYPKHYWPDDPLSAQATAKVKKWM